MQTESSSVATTLSTKQISTVPLATRNTLDFIAALPGVNTTGTIRNSTVMGLQASATNITIDGINVQDNYLKSSDGFFARINPRMDAVVGCHVVVHADGRVPAELGVDVEEVQRLRDRVARREQRARRGRSLQGGQQLCRGRVRRGCLAVRRREREEAVSYTHLTLPTKRIV